MAGLLGRGAGTAGQRGSGAVPAYSAAAAVSTAAACARAVSCAAMAFVTPPAPGTDDWPMTLSVSRSVRPVLVLCVVVQEELTTRATTTDHARLDPGDPAPAKAGGRGDDRFAFGPAAPLPRSPATLTWPP